MNYFNKKIYIIILTTLLFAGISACQNSQPEKSSQTDGTIKTEAQPDNSSVDDDNDVAKLLASLNMHYFSDTVTAPEFELASVKGGRVSLSQYRGNVVFLSFWATW